MSHLKSLIIPYDINKTCVRHLETLPHEAMNPTKGVLFASSSEITTLGSFAAQVSVHDMKRTQNDMKTSSLEAKRHRRLTEKHTDWKRDFDRFYDRSKHTVNMRPPAYPDKTHVDSYLFYCEQQLKKHKVQGFSMFLNGTCNGLQIKKGSERVL